MGWSLLGAFHLGIHTAYLGDGTGDEHGRKSALPVRISQDLHAKKKILQCGSMQSQGLHGEGPSVFSSTVWSAG